MSNTNSQPSFSLTVNTTPAATAMTLVSFESTDELNRLFSYQFTVQIPQNKGVNMKSADFSGQDAVFTIHTYNNALYGSDIVISGYISALSKHGGYWILTFSPDILRKTTNHRSEIYFSEAADLSAEEIVRRELQDDLNTTNSSFQTWNRNNQIIDFNPALPDQSLFCQYNESNFDFIGRLCDKWGIYFYFDHFEGNFVFSNNNHYDSRIQTSFSVVTQESADNRLDLTHWDEMVRTNDIYVTVSGYNPHNASTPPESSYPQSPASTSVEHKFIYADVTSATAAAYLAQIRYEQSQSDLITTTCRAYTPHAMPGFTITTDDDDNFTGALIVKSRQVVTGMIANSDGSFTGTYYNELTMIPSSVQFRSQDHYAVPVANNAIGRVVSDTNNQTMPLRNQYGEYKIELQGFDNENNVHPWVRRAQTTAGANSHDMPLTPGTDVHIGFIGGNPDCPIIEFAVDNSLVPAPVTNANPHHAVWATMGMLSIKSEMGKFWQTETINQQAVTDTNVSGTVKNHFISRGTFDQNANFIDPSVQNPPAFSDNDRDSGAYIYQRKYGDQIQINVGDRLHWHNGNLYDFGGYWNFNLGNSYEENFIDQAAPLNIKVDQGGYSGDILPTAGPDAGSVDFSLLVRQKDGKDLLSADKMTPATYGVADIPAKDNSNASRSFQVAPEGNSNTWHTNALNVSKSYNASYDYKFGDGIEISDRVNSLEITHTDGNTNAIEVVYHNNQLRSWSETVGRDSYEKKWTSKGKKSFEGSSVTVNDVRTDKEKSTLR